MSHSIPILKHHRNNKEERISKSLEDRHHLSNSPKHVSFRRHSPNPRRRGDSFLGKSPQKWVQLSDFISNNMEWNVKQPSLQAGLADRLAYNFDSEENVSKWKGLFVDSLRKVHRQVWPSLTVGTGTLEYLESLILQLLRVLCACQPHSVQDVEDRVRKTFPNPIDKWAICDAQAAVEKGRKKCDLVLPVDKVHNLLVKEVLAYKIDMQVSRYIVAVLEHIAADILKLTGNYVKYIPRQDIHSQDIMVAMCADNVLMEMFSQDDEGIAVPIEEENVQKRESVNYAEMVRDFMFEENQYVKDLNMIIKVFRQPFFGVITRLGEQDPVFSNILDIHRLTLSLLSSVEDTIEMTDEAEIPAVGPCFLDIAEAEELDVYAKYAEDVLEPLGREKLNEWLQIDKVQSQIKDCGIPFELAIKYVLPKLLLGPIYHCLHYFEVIESLTALTDSEEDRDMLKDACASLRPIQVTLDSICAGTLPQKRPMESSFRFLCHTEKSAACAKMIELQKSIDGWEGRNLSECAKEFVMEGPLQKLAGKKLTDRHVFMFDSLLVLCKQNTRRSSVTGAVGEFRFKEKFTLRRSHILDKEDSDDGQHMFELQTREHGNVTMVARSAEDKNNWMAALVFLQTRSTLERMLENQLMEEERKQPPQLPPPDQYIFSEADSDDNIVFEENTDYLSCPLIRGGTLLKLVERLTYHKYYDPNFVRTFLTTYRAFCSPKELLNLLIVRFRIPEPQVEDVLSEGATEDEKISARDYVKRFRLVYSKPIKFRVLNVMRQWVTKHFYDFERDPQLLTDLQAFLETVRGKDMKKGVDSIIRRLQTRVVNCPISDAMSEKPPVEWHLTQNPEEFNLLTLHPVEIARQVTLLEFEMYRAVKTSELVGSVWTKSERSQTSPNLLRMIRHTTTFTFWLERCIVEAENFEERVAIMTRALELMLVFQELNNFNGVIAVTSALDSAAVFRLVHSFEEQPAKLMRAFEEAKELNTDHYKKCIEKLRSINPPCVPFLGMYLTNILHTEEGNMDFLPKRENMINFRKLRKVAEITGEIQQYQDLPYSFTLVQSIRDFFEQLDPLEGRTEKELEDYLYWKSMEIEPRHSRAPAKFPRKWQYSLKSPGIKQMNLRSNSRHPNSELKPISAGASRLSEDGDPECSSPNSNPTTPNTPASPNRCDSGVFENIVIPTTPQVSSRLHSNSVTGYGFSSTLTATYFGSTSTASTITTEGSTDDEPPPPVPPRSHLPNKNRHSSTSFDIPHLMPVPQRRLPPPEVPVVPPRVPPVPPRRDVSLHGTLPRAHTQSPIRQSRGYTSSTLPRRHSERDHVMNAYGQDSMTIPALPPKSDRGNHGDRAGMRR